MADTSQVLNDVADALRGPLYTSVAELIAERDALAASNAELTGEDVAESAAAESVRTAVAELGALFASPELPDVPPDLPPTEEPTPEG